MKKFFRDFISHEERQFTIKIGKTIASSLAGFIAGIIFTLLAIASGWLIVTVLQIHFG